MLLSFRFANHRSFRDEQQLNLTPAYERLRDDADLAPATVPVAGIFGANASGKSNVISALDYLRRMVGTSDRETEPGLGPRRQPFRLDPAIASEPSSYAVDLMLDQVRHTYGFTLNDEQILQEWLYSYPLRKKRVVFERTGQDFRWGEESSRSSLRRLAEIIAPTALYLSVSARFQGQASADQSRDDTSSSLHSTFTWLWRQVRSTQLSAADRGVQTVGYYGSLSDPGRRAVIVKLLRAADVGLRDVFIASDASDEIPLDPEVRRAPGLSRSAIQRTGRGPRKLQFLHYGSVDDVALDISEESSGTLRLMDLAARAVDVLEQGGLFLVDEIDASLHPLLTASLIRLFRSAAANQLRAQLVFTSHDASLLGVLDGEEVLERDQIWFTEKREDGSSLLFPLIEFKPRRQGENRQRRYLNGNYGAIPDLSMGLFEQALTSRNDADAS